MSTDFNRKQDGMTVVYCEKGGQHQGERLEYICLHALCRQDRLGCRVCKNIKHNNHEIIQLEELVSEVERKAIGERRKSYLAVLGELEKRREQACGILKNIRAFTLEKQEKIEKQVSQFFVKTKKEIEDGIQNGLECSKIRTQRDKVILEMLTQDMLDKSVIKDKKVNAYFEGEDFKQRSDHYREGIDEFVGNLFDSAKKIQAVFTQTYQTTALQYQKENENELISFSPLQANSGSQYQVEDNNMRQSIERSNYNTNHIWSGSNSIQGGSQNKIDNNISINKIRQHSNNSIGSPTYSPKIMSQNSIKKDQFTEIQKLSLKHMEMMKQIQEQQAMIDQITLQRQRQLSLAHSQTTQSVRSNNFQLPSQVDESRISPNNRSQTTYQSISPSRLLYYSSIFKYLPQNTSQQNIESPYGVFWKKPSTINQNNSTTQIRAASPLAQSSIISKSEKKSPDHHGNSNSFNLEKKTRWWDQEDEQDINDTDFQNTRMSQVPRIFERIITFKFDKKLKHQTIECVDKIKFLTIKGSSDCNKARVAIAIPSLQTVPLKEFRWSFQILRCQSVAYSNPLAVGICLRKHIEQAQFDFNGEDNLQNKRANSRNEESTHGCYLLTSAGFIRNHTDSSQDMKKVSVRFDQGDIILCHFNPFRKYLKIKNKNSGQLCMINIDFKPSDSLHPCVRISYCQDMVQIIEEYESEDKQIL